MIKSDRLANRLLNHRFGVIGNRGVKINFVVIFLTIVFRRIPSLRMEKCKFTEQL